MNAGMGSADKREGLVWFATFRLVYLAINTRTFSSRAQMLTPSTRLRLQNIIERIANSEPVSLNERIVVQKFADRDPSVWGWLKQAQRKQLEGLPRTGLDRFLADMNLGEVGPKGAFDPKNDDLGEWFSGAPPWLRRS
ncbi:MAG: hypothetical protein VKL58_07920 [Cyanobacteriota bacterium]|nr:hypothetical protein [Cyanobacteriota bacterium]